jgi:LemA protein
LLAQRAKDVKQERAKNGGRRAAKYRGRPASRDSTKEPAMHPAWIAAIVAGVVIVFVVGIYNGLIGKWLETRNAYSQIEVQLKRRYDLIPNLVETVKGYASHEKDTLEKIVQARTAAMTGNKPVAEQAAAENQLTQAVRGLMVSVEAYPDLKANTNFLQLQEELGATENRIAFSRQHYNDSVGVYNASRMSFPTNIIAGIFRFERAQFFEVPPEEAAAIQKAPSIKF